MLRKKIEKNGENASHWKIDLYFLVAAENKMKLYCALLCTANILNQP